MPLPLIQPLTLERKPEPFSHPDWLFELKWDGFRALARIDYGKCRLISRNGNEFKSFSILNSSLLEELGVQSAILDGEIVCLDKKGTPQFKDLMFRRSEPRLVVFDLLYVNGQDLRYAPLTERKHRLRSILSSESKRIIYCDHIDQDGKRLFRLACKKDLEGIVGKRKFDPYIPDQASWVKIRNPHYSQWAGREKLFERERDSDPDLRVWDECVLACEGADG